MEASLNNFRKAAILVATLDGPDAEEVLARLPHSQADQVRRAAEDLGAVSRSEREAALREFGEATSPSPPPPRQLPAERGVELDGSLVSLLDRYDSGAPLREGMDVTSRSMDAKIECIDHLDGDEQVAPFGFLDQAEPSTLATILQNEHPQSVAVVLSSVAADRAAEMLTCLPEQLQLDVLHRMSELEPGDPESLRLLAGELRTWVEARHRDERRRDRGITTIREILAATAEKDQENLVRRIREHDTVLAERLGDEMRYEETKQESLSPVAGGPVAGNPVAGNPVQSQQSVVRGPTVSAQRAEVEQPARLSSAAIRPPSQRPPQRPTANLGHLGDTEWVEILSAIEPQILVLALAGEEQELIDRVASHFDTKDAQALRQSLKSLSPVRLSDVAVARGELVRIASQITHSQSALPLSA